MEQDPLANFMTQVLVQEGAWVIEPDEYSPDYRYVRDFLDRLRTVRARIRNPRGTSAFRFAERGTRGRWFFVWVEDKE